MYLGLHRMYDIQGLLHEAVSLLRREKIKLEGETKFTDAPTKTLT